MTPHLDSTLQPQCPGVIPCTVLLDRVDEAIAATRHEYDLADRDEDYQWARNYGYRLEGLRQARRIIEDWIAVLSNSIY